MHPLGDIVTGRAFREELEKLAAEKKKRFSAIQAAASIGSGVAGGLLGKRLGIGTPTGMLAGLLAERGAESLMGGYEKKAELTKEAPARSVAQQQFMAIELRKKREGKKTKTDMTEKELHDFASTSHEGLPEHVKKAESSTVDKTALEKATILKAIFQRAYKGKIVGPTAGRMASRFLETSRQMGNEPTRQGLRDMITKVKTTGGI